jgi:hypothetical protein
VKSLPQTNESAQQVSTCSTARLSLTNLAVQTGVSDVDHSSKTGHVLSSSNHEFNARTSKTLVYLIQSVQQEEEETHNAGTL